MTAPTGTALMMAVFVLGIGDVLSINRIYVVINSLDLDRCSL